MTDQNAILDSAFPFMKADVAKGDGQSMDGAEAMNRVAGKQPTTGPGRTGRPRKNKPELLTHPKDPTLTAVVFSDDDEQTIKRGAVLQVRMADGKLKSIVLLHDLRFALLAP